MQAGCIRYVQLLLAVLVTYMQFKSDTCISIYINAVSTRRMITPHMNIHLAQLHIHVCITAIYGIEVKVFPYSSDVSQSTFPVNWKFTCAVALAHVTRPQCIPRLLHSTTLDNVGCANSDQATYRWCIFDFTCSVSVIYVQAD